MRTILALSTALAATPSLAGDVTVQVTGIDEARGKVSVAVCQEVEFLKTCRLANTVSAKAGSVSVRFAGVAPGAYAIQAHHDKDGDGKVGTNMIGIPNEPIGFSRDPAMRFGPPAFKDAAVTVGSGTLTVPIRLKSY